MKFLWRVVDDLLDSAVLAAFHFRTRRFLKMESVAGEMPPLPRVQDACLYLHIPFCKSLCPFCSFHRVQHDHRLSENYFQSLREEVRGYSTAGFRFATAYFGGGTPTIEPVELIKTIRLVVELFGVREVSVETNPNDLEPQFLQQLSNAGVTRLSVGVQSFNNELLREMHRLDAYGTGEHAAERIRRATTIFQTVNVDLIFNQPHQTADMLNRDIDIFRDTEANQVSFYPLMQSPGHRRTPTFAHRQRVREFYRTIIARLRPDFRPTSAWCFTRRGNANDEYIVEADNYIGVGSGAFSYVNGVLYATTFCLRTYEHLIAEGMTGITVRSELSRTEQMRYSLLLKMFGLNLDRQWALSRFGSDFFKTVWPELKALELLGAATRSVNGWRLTDRGMYLLVLMMTDFFEAVAKYRESMRLHIPAETSGLKAVPSPSHRTVTTACQRTPQLTGNGCPLQ